MAEARQVADVVRRARSGDRDAFQDLVGPYIQPAYKLAFTFLRQRQDAEDALQESVLKAWTKLAQLRDGVSLKAWFFQIVVNECRMSRRRRWATVIKLPDLQVRRQHSEDHLIQTTDLRRALTELSEPERLILFLYYELDLDLDEVAAISGISPAAAKSRLYRAIRRLRPSVGEAEEFS